MPKLSTLLAAALLLPCLANAQVPPAYRATVLGGGVAMALNNKGQVAGLDAQNRPTVWGRDGSATLLPGQVYEPQVLGINDDGTVVGFGLLSPPDTGGNYQPLAWRNGGVQRLDVAGVGGIASAINQRGDTIGFVESGGEWPWFRGFVQRAGDTVYFDTFNANALNDLGVVVGQGEQGIATWSDGAFSDVAHGCCGFASAINNHGWIIGADWGSEGYYAAMWKEGQVIRLWNGWAYDINDAGMVVGESEQWHATLWYQGQVYVLDHLWTEPQWAGWGLMHALAINDSGEIVADAFNVEDGTRMTVLLSPVPEPAMGWLLLLGVPLLSLGRRSA